MYKILCLIEPEDMTNAELILALDYIRKAEDMTGSHSRNRLEKVEAEIEKRIEKKQARNSQQISDDEEFKQILKEEQKHRKGFYAMLGIYPENFPQQLIRQISGLQGDMFRFFDLREKEAYYEGRVKIQKGILEIRPQLTHLISIFNYATNKLIAQSMEYMLSNPSEDYSTELEEVTKLRDMAIEEENEEFNQILLKMRLVDDSEDAFEPYKEWMPVDEEV